MSILELQDKASRCLDLSALPRERPDDVGGDAVILLQEALHRTELPPYEEIPGREGVESAGIEHWTIPYTVNHRGIAEGGNDRPEPRILDLRGRFMLATMFYLSKGVVIPQRDLDRKAVKLTLDEHGEVFDWQLVSGDLFRIESSDVRPEFAFRVAHYRNSWFYIRDDDTDSKDTFMLFTSLLSLRAGEAPRSSTPVTLPIR